MNIKRNSPFHRYLSLAILVLLLCLFGLLYLSYHSQKIEVQQRYEKTQLQLQKYTTLATNFPQIKAENQNLLLDQSNDNRYLAAATSSLAAAELQKKTQLIIQQSKAKLLSLRVKSTIVERGFLPITLQLHMQLTNDKLLTMLYQLENNTPIGFIYKLQIQQQRNYQSLDDNVLDVRLEYTSFMVAPDDT